MKRLIGFLAVSAMVAQAQTSVTPSELKTYLGLSDSQVSGLQQIQQSARTEARPIREEMRAKAQQLRDMNKNGTGDAATLGQLVVDIRSARQRLQPLRTRSHDQAMALLTPDQKAKLSQLEMAAKNRRELRQAARLGLLNVEDRLGLARQRAQRRERSRI